MVTIMFVWFNIFSKKLPSNGQFILTKEYTKNNKKGGGLVLRVEKKIGESFSCSKGSFQIRNDLLEWILKEPLINISISNIDRTLTNKEAVKLLREKTAS